MKTVKLVKQGFGDFFTMIKTPTLAGCAIVSFVLCLLNLGLLIWRVVPMSADRPFMPLHYNIYLGIDRFGSWKELFLIPVIAFLILLFNLFLQSISFKRERVLSFFFAISTVFLELILLCAVGLILLLILSYAA